jgi:hypothetical protein
MEPTEIDKGACKRVGYIPDYSIWRTGFPLLVSEVSGRMSRSRRRSARRTYRRPKEAQGGPPKRRTRAAGRGKPPAELNRTLIASCGSVRAGKVAASWLLV